MKLETRLNRLLKKEPKKYKKSVVERVRKLVRYETENPEKLKRYRFLERIDDFVLYYNLHPEWHGKTISEMTNNTSEGGNAYYQAFWKLVKKQTRDKKKQKELRQKIFKSIITDWSSYKTIDDWIKEYKKHPEWQGKTRFEMFEDKSEGGRYYAAFWRWVKKQTKIPKKIQELVSQIFEPSYNDWSSYKTIDDWIKEYKKHPEWHGKTISEMQHDKSEDGNAYYRAFWTWIRKQTRDKKKQKELRQKIFKQKYTDHSHYKTIDDWIEEYNNHPEWHGKSISEMQRDKSEGGRKYYVAFGRWVNKQTKSLKKKQELVNQIFIDRKHNIQFAFGQAVVSFDSRPERIIGLLLHKYGLIRKFEEDKNLHVFTNGRRRHSIDFLVGQTFIEFHPLHYSEVKKKITLAQAGNMRLRYITNDEYKPCYFWHMWEIDQLYDILKDRAIRPMMNKRYQNLSEELFLKHLEQAYEQAADYDKRFPGPKKIKPEDREDYSKPKLRVIKGKKKEANEELLEEYSMAA